MPLTRHSCSPFHIFVLLFVFMWFDIFNWFGIALVFVVMLRDVSPFEPYECVGSGDGQMILI